MKKVLISPIGNHDPIGKGYDGPMLHIVRYYIPDEIYLLLTTDMYQRHLKDNRYKICIDWLNSFLKEKGKTQKDIQAHIINLNIENPSRYESFPIISQEIDKIMNKEKDADFLMNISSGTQQMGMAIGVDIVSNNRKIKPIQVASPDHKSTVTFNKDDDWQQQMRDNGDNFPELNQGNRCIETDLHVLRNERLFAKIESLIDSYRYSNALELLRYEERFNNTSLFTLIKVAHAYSNYNIMEVNSLKKDLDIDLPKNFMMQLLTVAYNNLVLKTFTKEYNEFCTRITPLFFNLLVELIGEETIKEITYEDKNVKYIDINKLSKYKYLNINCKDKKPLSSYYMLFLYLDLFGDNQTYKQMQIIREVERTVRNPVAHEIKAVSEKTIKSLSGYYVEDVINAFKDILLNNFHKINKNHLMFYKNINKLIKDAIVQMKS